MKDPPARPGCAVRVAAAADLHFGAGDRGGWLAALAQLPGSADLLLLAGDLTTHGEPGQVVPLASACARLELPVFAVLGNHDWHADRSLELTNVLREAGICVLEGGATTVEVAGTTVGIAGVKGFVGGFAGSFLPDFGEPLLRRVYAETSAEVEALERGLQSIAHCPLRIVLLHYAPTELTLAGEPPGIHAFLGSGRLAAPIARHRPHLVLHGHAHAGSFAARISEVPVFNVAVPMLGRELALFELQPRSDPVVRLVAGPAID